MGDCITPKLKTLDIFICNGKFFGALKRTNFSEQVIWCLFVVHLNCSIVSVDTTVFTVHVFCTNSSVNLKFLFFYKFFIIFLPLMPFFGSFCLSCLAFQFFLALLLFLVLESSLVTFTRFLYW